MPDRIIRRNVLLGILVATLALAGLPSGLIAGEPDLLRLSEHLAVHRGPINVGVVLDGDRALLIDCAGAGLERSLSALDITQVDRILFTHYHRDQMRGVRKLIGRGAKVWVPAAERAYFEAVEDFWNAPDVQMRRYRTLRPHHLMSVESITVDAALDDRQEFVWGDATIRLLTTPGHTNGSASYQVDVDGRRVIFSGDTIHGPGQVWNIHALQKGVQTSGYHGFLGARTELVESLAKLKAARPDSLVPSHGQVMHEPGAAIDLLTRRLDVCYDHYVAISALRHYKPEVFEEYADRKDHMPFSAEISAPDCLAHIGTTWILKSESGAAFVMDCGNPSIVPKIEEMIDRGEITSVEGLWITHYHHDHVDGMAEFQATFDCPCITDEHVAQVIMRPSDWRLPCISPVVARVDRITRGRQTWNWHEYTLTAMHLPGQTLHHSGLLVEGAGLRLFFVGDSFTMAGIDDYCANNRNWLGPDVGFQHCLTRIEELDPTHIFNCHVDVAWDFTPEEIRFMRENLTERETLFGQIVPWAHANFGMDDSWVRTEPYQQMAAPGETVKIEVVVTNHAEQSVAIGASLSDSDRDELSTTIDTKGTGRISIRYQVPADAEPGRYVVPVDVRLDERDLPAFTEAMIDVEAGSDGS